MRPKQSEIKSRAYVEMLSTFQVKLKLLWFGTTVAAARQLPGQLRPVPPSLRQKRVSLPRYIAVRQDDHA